jgi:hypothetical protein
MIILIFGTVPHNRLPGLNLSLGAFLELTIIEIVKKIFSQLNDFLTHSSLIFFLDNFGQVQKHLIFLFRLNLCEMVKVKLLQ